MRRFPLLGILFLVGVLAGALLLREHTPGSASAGLDDGATPVTLESAGDAAMASPEPEFEVRPFVDSHQNDEERQRVLTLIVEENGQKIAVPDAEVQVIDRARLSAAQRALLRYESGRDAFAFGLTPLKLHSDGSGRVLLPRTPLRIDVRASKDSLFGEEFFAPEEGDRLELRLQPDDPLEVLVLDSNGQPVPRIKALVVSSSPEDEGSHWGAAWTDELGIARFHLEPTRSLWVEFGSSNAIAVDVPGLEGNTVPLPSRRPDSPLVLRLPPTGALRVRLLGEKAPHEDLGLEVFPSTLWSRSPRTHDFTLRHIEKELLIPRVACETNYLLRLQTDEEARAPQFATIDGPERPGETKLVEIDLNARERLPHYRFRLRWPPDVPPQPEALLTLWLRKPDPSGEQLWVVRDDFVPGRRETLRFLVARELPRGDGPWEFELLSHGHPACRARIEPLVAPTPEGSDLGTIHLEKPPATPWLICRGVVLDPEGKPARSRVTLARNGEESSAYSGKDGRFVLGLAGAHRGGARITALPEPPFLGKDWLPVPASGPITLRLIRGSRAVIPLRLNPDLPQTVLVSYTTLPTVRPMGRIEDGHLIVEGLDDKPLTIELQYRGITLASRAIDLPSGPIGRTHHLPPWDLRAATRSVERTIRVLSSNGSAIVGAKAEIDGLLEPTPFQTSDEKGFIRCRVLASALAMRIEARGHHPQVLYGCEEDSLVVTLSPIRRHPLRVATWPSELMPPTFLEATWEPAFEHDGEQELEGSLVFAPGGSGSASFRTPGTYRFRFRVVCPRGTHRIEADVAGSNETITLPASGQPIILRPDPAALTKALAELKRRRGE